MRKYFFGLAALFIVVGGAILGFYGYELGSGMVLKDVAATRTAGSHALGFGAAAQPGGTARSVTLRLTPGMNPLRVNASVDVRRPFTVMPGQLYSMKADLLNPGGTEIWQGSHSESTRISHRARRRHRGTGVSLGSRRRELHSVFTLGTFEVRRAGTYRLEASVTPGKGGLMRADITIRRNVKVLPASVPITGGVLLAAGMMILVISGVMFRKRSSKAPAPGA